MHAIIADIWGIDSNDITAWATIIALMLAVVPPSIKTLLQWRRTPSPTPFFNKHPKFSAPYSVCYFIRIPVYNPNGKNEARNVQVYLESAITNKDASTPGVEKYITPMRLKWCNNGSLSENIPAGCFRLFDLLHYPINIPPDSFTIEGENSHYFNNADGSDLYELSLTISADDIEPKKHTIFFRLSPESPNQKHQLFTTTPVGIPHT